MAITRHSSAPCAHGPGCPHDIGPAAAHGDGVNAIAARDPIETVRVELAQAAGAGPVERRYGPAADRPAKPVDTIASVAKPTPPEEIAVPATPPLTSPPAIPCGTCLKADVCGIKGLLGDEPWNAEPEYFAPGLRAVHAVIAIECDHYLGAVIPARPNGSANPGGEAIRTRLISTGDAAAEMAKVSRQRGASHLRKASDDQLIEALRTAGGNKHEAARILGMSVTTVRRRTETLEDLGRMPADVAATLTTTPGTRPRTTETLRAERS